MKTFVHAFNCFRFRVMCKCNSHYSMVHRHRYCLDTQVHPDSSGIISVSLSTYIIATADVAWCGRSVNGARIVTSRRFIAVATVSDDIAPCPYCHQLSTWCCRRDYNVPLLMDRHWVRQVVTLPLFQPVVVSYSLTVYLPIQLAIFVSAYVQHCSNFLFLPLLLSLMLLCLVMAIPFPLHFMCWHHWCRTTQWPCGHLLSTWCCHHHY